MKRIILVFIFGSLPKRAGRKMGYEQMIKYCCISNGFTYIEGKI